MPFLGQDWRSPGDQWVRTKEGWERLKLWRIKVFENLNESILARLIRLAVLNFEGENGNDKYTHQPRIHFIKTLSRERKVVTTLSESFILLDMTGAVKDIRRFNYVKKILHVLLSNSLVNMSGTSQKYIFSILDEMVNQVVKTKNNMKAMTDLLDCATNSLNDGRYSHIGCTTLWNKHFQAVQKMKNKLNGCKTFMRKEDGKPTISDLPEDCIRCILERLADHKDVVHTGMTKSSIFHITESQLIWKHMSFFHFTDRQLLTFVPDQLGVDEDFINWKHIYRKCFLRYGRKEIYADTLAICLHCDNIFWKSIGHPCINEQEPAARILQPEAFLKLFHF
ncbi:F-box protein 25/32 [Mytilus galloprovincialis]|uniref:F-box protein 25/32 n=1 Tax=Mytilus galloprovincialis TaxID=29158 RepID=A0A8B6CWW4_MYTGA|nr:F-box protein 25/32 [Mytilus galloprovincialis]